MSFLLPLPHSLLQVMNQGLVACIVNGSEALPPGMAVPLGGIACLSNMIQTFQGSAAFMQLEFKSCSH